MGCKIKSYDRDCICYDQCCYGCPKQNECFAKGKGCMFFLDLEFNFDKGSHKKCINYREEDLKMSNIENNEQLLKEEQLNKKPIIYSEVDALVCAIHYKDFIVHFIPSQEGVSDIYSTDNEFNIKRGATYTIEQPLLTLVDVLTYSDLASGSLLVISNLINDGRPCLASNISEIFYLCRDAKSYDIAKSLRFFPKANNNNKGV